jgi:Zn-dependent peptidase ImmA (M78 family)
VRVNVRRELLVWARERAGADPEELGLRFPNLRAWEEGEREPTLKQLEDYARVTKTPIGYLLLREPPEEPVPIPDFRTMLDESVRRPSPDLLDTVALCQRRQEWYRDFARRTGAEPMPFVRSLGVRTPVADAAVAMRETLAFDIDERGRSWSTALRALIDRAEGEGVLVMVNGIVGNNTHRALNPREFRGFALVDDLAPLVFINGADTKAAQIFTLAHELAHLWIGQSALSNAGPAARPPEGIERWCNQVAAEFLVPVESVRQAFDPHRDLTEELDRLALLFKVSTLVVLRRIFDAGGITWDAYREAYEAEEERVRGFLEARPEGGGGDFFNSAPLRASRRFSRALIASTIEGQTLYRDAFQLLAVRKSSTFDELASRLSETN